MQNDYQVLYEILKYKTDQLEKIWKFSLSQFKESNSSNTEVVNDSVSRASMLSSASSFIRRINPTHLKNETIPRDDSFLSTQFESANLNLVNEKLLNRPVNESVWKKLPSSNVQIIKVIDADEDDFQFDAEKMKFSNYFNEKISSAKKENLKKFASAYYKIVFNEVVVDFSSFTECFGIILRILSVGNETIFRLKQFSKKIIDDFLFKSFQDGNDSIFEKPIELMIFSIYWIQGSRDQIIKLLPDSLKCFEKNLLLNLLDPSICQFFKLNHKKEESPFNPSPTTSSLNSLLPVAYTNKRDSKNFLKDPTSHANQQKIRDIFINLIRHFSTNQLDTSHPNFHRSFGIRVSELMGKVNNENFSWLAHLYIQEYEQAADVRLDRFEDRMTSRRPVMSNNTASSTTFSLDQIFFIFLQYADSFRLTRAVEKKTIAIISVSLEQANNPHKRALWPECIRKLRSTVKLLAFCRYKMSEILCGEDEPDNSISVEEEDVLVFSWTQEAILNRQILTLLPLIYEYFTFIGPNSIKSRCSNTVKLLLRYYQVKFESKRKRSHFGLRAKLILKLCLEDLFRETLNSEFYSECLMSLNEINEEVGLECQEEGIEEEKQISQPKTKDNGVLSRALDEDDDQLPPSISNVYRSISSQLRGIYVQLNSICMNVGLNNEKESLGNSHNALSTINDSTPRKVRPITQVPAADLKHQKIQKQLRQWFWWRYGSQKDLIDTLNSYILEQILFPQFPISASRHRSSEICTQMYRELIYKILPDLLPNFWKDQPELIEIIINLSLEIAVKIIKHHFS